MESFFRMKTFLIEKPEAFSFGEAKMPEVKAGEVLLKIERVGLCGGDLTMFRGLNPMVTYPRIPGHEIAATIAKSARACRRICSRVCS
jgi:D-arabinose 1-dehydrogenase-like Zn-dependent alcohol dehydrogenase